MMMVVLIGHNAIVLFVPSRMFPVFVGAHSETVGMNISASRQRNSGRVG